MGGDGELSKLAWGFIFPLVLVLAGGGLLTLGLSNDSLIAGIAGAALIGLGLIWIFIACVINGINPFDL